MHVADQDGPHVTVILSAKHKHVSLRKALETFAVCQHVCRDLKKNIMKCTYTFIIGGTNRNNWC